LKRFKHWQRKYSRKGIDPERLQLQWVSAAEGKEFAEKIKEMDTVINTITVSQGAADSDSELASEKTT
jgi:heterodisulfide reductase subunit A